MTRPNVRYLDLWLSLAAMVVVTAAAAAYMAAVRAVLLGFDAGALVFITGTVHLMVHSNTGDMRERARENDPDAHIALGIAMLIVGIVLVAVTVELTGIGGDHGSGLAIAGATILLAWVFSNLLFALHYAHSFYAPADRDDGDDSEPGDTGGLDFPGDEAPVYSDFAYFSFTLGMTFQVSDVEITGRSLRLLALYHSLTAFLFNIVVVALSVSVLGNLLQK